MAVQDPGSLLNIRAREFPHRAAIVFRKETVDFLTLNCRANRLAHALSDMGVRYGDKAGILIPNSPEFVIAYLAIRKVGGVAVPLDIRLREEDVDELLDFTEAAILLTTPDIKVSQKRPSLMIKGDTITSKGNILDPSEQDMGVDPPSDAEAAYLCTSGSTGGRKVVALTLENLNQFPKIMRAIFETRDDDIYGMLLPMSHVSGPVIIHELIRHGTRLVIFDQLRGRSILQSIEKNGVTVTWGVSPIGNLLVRAAKKRNLNTSKLRVMILMGMEVPLSLVRELTDAFPSTAVVQGYGLTETSGVIAGTLPKDAISHMGSIGRPASCIEIMIMDDKGSALPQGREGEIAVRGPAVMKGYHKNSRATRQRIRDSWLLSGDIGCFDEDGYLYHMGRRDDMIISGGLNLFPAEVEDVIRKLPGVSDVAVAGVPDPKRGQVVKASIVCSPEGSEEEILKLCREALLSHKRPRIVEFCPELPKTSSGKVSRSAIRNRK